MDYFFFLFKLAKSFTFDRNWQTKQTSSWKSVVDFSGELSHLYGTILYYLSYLYQRSVLILPAILPILKSKPKVYSARSKYRYLFLGRNLALLLIVFFNNYSHCALSYLFLGLNHLLFLCQLLLIMYDFLVTGSEYIIIKIINCKSCSPFQRDQFISKK